jgi:hypothetical protein
MNLLLCDRFLNIEQYHSIYLQDLDIQLDAEFEYPYPPSLIKNLEYVDKGIFDVVFQ